MGLGLRAAAAAGASHAFVCAVDMPFITADLIDLGSINQLTLQMHAVIPARVYPGMRIGQVTFWAVEGPEARDRR